jgi:hypothetical protein
MTIALNCPHCGRLLRTSDDRAGQTAKCPGCGEPISIPVNEPPHAEVPQAEIARPEQVQAAPADAAASDDGNRKPCPLCGEMVLSVARKCRFCGESIGDGVPVRPHVEKDPHSLELTDVLLAGWELFKRHMLMAVGGMVVAGALQMIPVSGIWIAVLVAAQGPEAEPIAIAIVAGTVLIGMVISTYLSCGLNRLLLNIAYDRDPQITDLFAFKFNTLLSMLAANFIQGMCVTIGLMFCFVPGIILSLMWMPLHFVIVDQELGPIAALAESKRLTDGRKLNIFLIMLVANVIGSLGQMACYVGLLFTLPLAMVILATVYVRLKAKAGELPDAESVPATLADEA